MLRGGEQHVSGSFIRPSLIDCIIHAYMTGTFLPISCAAGLFDSWNSAMNADGLYMFGVCMMMVRIAMMERAQPGGDSCGIIILVGSLFVAKGYY